MAGISSYHTEATRFISRKIEELEKATGNSKSLPINDRKKRIEQLKELGSQLDTLRKKYEGTDDSHPEKKLLLDRYCNACSAIKSAHCLTNPQSSYYYAWVGEAFFYLQQYDASLEAFEKAPKWKPKKFYAQYEANQHICLAEQFFQAQEYKNAYDAFEEALALKPKKIFQEHAQEGMGWSEYYMREQQQLELAQS